MFMLSYVQLFETPGTAAHQVPLSMGISRQKYWSGLPFPTPHILLICLSWSFSFLLSPEGTEGAPEWPPREMRNHVEVPT